MKRSTEESESFAEGSLKVGNCLELGFVECLQLLVFQGFVKDYLLGAGLKPLLREGSRLNSFLEFLHSFPLFY